MTTDRLLARSKKELAEMARKKGIVGWHAMRKEELVVALVNASPKVTNGSHKATNGSHKANGLVKTRKALPIRAQVAVARDTSSTSAEEKVGSSKYDVGVPTKDLSNKVPRDLPGGYGKDRIVVMVRDPYWLHSYWELTRHAVQRAEAALGQDWHGAKPILRLLDVSARDTSNSAEALIRDIDIHGGCNNWY